MNKDTLRIKEFLLIISFLVLLVGLLWQAQLNEQKTISPYAQIQNMLAAPPVDANTYLTNYALYVPQGYKLKIVDSTVIIYNNESILSFYLGQGVELNSNFFESMNTDLEQLYAQSTSHDGVTTYTYAWQYDKSHVELLLGQSDSYIVAIYPKNKVDEAITDIALIFNSYQVIDDD